MYFRQTEGWCDRAGSVFPLPLYKWGTLPPQQHHLPPKNCKRRGNTENAKDEERQMPGHCLHNTGTKKENKNHAAITVTSWLS